jgi:hypothetical protein
VAFGPVATQHDDGVADRDGAGCQLEPAQDVGHPGGEQDDGDQSRGEGVGLAFCVEAGLLGASLDMEADNRVAASEVLLARRISSLRLL